MEPKRILCRTRGGRTQGWGNVFRLASFAEFCRARGRAEFTFFAEGPDEVVRFLEGRGFPVVHLGEGVTLEEERAALAAHDRVDLVMVEMLDVTPGRQRLLREHTDRLVVFDDLCDHVYDADLVVCGQALPSHANQQLSAAGTKFLVGYDYFLMRPEFRAYREREREYGAGLERVLVTLGGGRYDVGYRKAALALAELELERGRSVAATFVLGYDDRAELRAAIRAVLPRAEILGGVSDLDRLLWEHDVVIAGAGYTKLEAAITRTPQVVMSVQWHQIPLASTFATCTGVPDVGYMAYVQPSRLAAELRALESREARVERARGARDVVDGRGFERVYAAAFGTSEVESRCTVPAE